MSSKLVSPEYPDTMQVRRIHPTGQLSLAGERIFLSSVLAGEPVGIEPIEEDRWEVF